MKQRFHKSYELDGGTDIILDKTETFEPGRMTVVELGVNVNPPPNHLAILCPRSSLALKGLFIANCPIDSGYTGNVKAIVFNASTEQITVEKGERFCQFIVLRCIPNLYDVPFKCTSRENNGWGSSGK